MRVSPLSELEYEAVLPLIADYQRFYGVPEPDAEHNRGFFRRFIAPSADGVLLGAWRDDRLAGYACLYFTFSSVSATEIVLLNDLFVADDVRGAGIGRGLIEAAARVADDRGAGALRWWTALENRRAQRLYERVNATRSAWFEYELPAG